MITDVDLITLKKLGMKSGGFLMWEGPTTYEFYYANQSTIVFRYIAKKDKNSFALMQNMPIAVILNSPLSDGSQDNKEQMLRIERKLEEINVSLRSSV